MELKARMNDRDLQEFAMYLKDLGREIGFKVSARGWGYLLEQKRLINKDEFDKVANTINKCRRKGYLPINFVAEEDARAFKGVETPNTNTVIQDFGDWLDAAGNAAEHYTPDWWEGEEYYIQMLVEKIDLVTLFQRVCYNYHVPIANSKGWSSMLQRAEYSRRFAEAERKGLKCVLLYCGDHDPDGLRISEFIRKNLADLKDVVWSDGMRGYDPADLIIDRFGLNKDFIDDHGLSWIDNLITGSGNNLASPKHKNHYMDYVQDYLDEIGERKCEANAVVTMPREAKEMVEQAIVKYLGEDSLERFESKRQAVRDELTEFMDRVGLSDTIADAKKLIEEEYE